MNNTVKIQIRSVYGVDHVYPVCEAGQAFCRDRREARRTARRQRSTAFAASAIGLLK